jgi:phosphoribosylamine--glycine ligase
MVFHAGTRLDQGQVVTSGGRVLAITAYGEQPRDAVESAYETVKGIKWKDAYYRTDIGQDLLQWPNKALETSTE